MSPNPSLSAGDVVEVMVLRSEPSSAQFVVQLPGNVPGYLSWYDVSDELYSRLNPGSIVRAIVDRVEPGAVATVVLRGETEFPLT